MGTKMGNSCSNNRHTTQILNKRGGAPRDGEGQCAIASEEYLLDVEVRLHNVHMHDEVLITKNDEHVEEISMKQ